MAVENDQQKLLFSLQLRFADVMWPLTLIPLEAHLQSSTCNLLLACQVNPTARDQTWRMKISCATRISILVTSETSKRQGNWNSIQTMNYFYELDQLFDCKETFAGKNYIIWLLLVLVQMYEAEQRQKQEERRQEELRQQYIKEQEIYKSKWGRIWGRGVLYVIKCMVTCAFCCLESWLERPTLSTSCMSHLQD